MPAERGRVRGWFWLEASLAGLTGLMFILTLLWHDWLEAFGLDPDRGDGTVEWLVVAGFLVCSVALSAGAIREWRRAEFAPA